MTILMMFDTYYYILPPSICAQRASHDIIYLFIIITPCALFLQPVGGGRRAAAEARLRLFPGGAVAVKWRGRCAVKVWCAAGKGKVRKKRVRRAYAKSACVRTVGKGRCACVRGGACACAAFCRFLCCCCFFFIDFRCLFLFCFDFIIFRHFH